MTLKLHSEENSLMVR